MMLMRAFADGLILLIITCILRMAWRGLLLPIAMYLAHGMEGFVVHRGLCRVAVVTRSA